MKTISAVSNFFRIMKLNAMTNAKDTIKELSTIKCPHCEIGKLHSCDYDAIMDKIIYRCDNCNRQFL